MSLHHDIKHLLGIEDENIFFSKNCTREEQHKGIRCMIVSAKLTYQPSKYQCYKAAFDSNVIKHGFKKTKNKRRKESAVV